MITVVPNYSNNVEDVYCIEKQWLQKRNIDTTVNTIRIENNYAIVLNNVYVNVHIDKNATFVGKTKSQPL